MNSAELLRVFQGLASPRVLVLGDVVLDRYTWGNAERISQEAPIVVLRADERQSLMGGAANVCHLVRGLDAQARCAAVVGDDEAGRTLRDMLEQSGTNCDLLLTDRDRPTTVKERFVGRAAGRHASQILRVDEEVREPLSGSLEEALLRGLDQLTSAHDVLLISDYGKGVCTPRVLQAAIRKAIECHIPVLVDPSCGGDLEYHRGATLLKPNRTETEVATGIKITEPADAIVAGRQLCQQLGLQQAVITLDRDGMVWVGREGTGKVVPTAARSVYDITGAGDMALAMLGVGIGGGASPLDAVHLANVAAGLEVERMGVAAIRPEEIRAQLVADRIAVAKKIVPCDQAARVAADLRCQGRKVVFTNGCFDLLHVGHLTILTAAAALGDVLVVGVNSDASVRRLKGEHRPVIRQEDRATLLAALASVDLVVIFDDETPHRLLHAIRPDVLVKGGNYAVDEVVGHEVVEAYGGQVSVTGFVEGTSTTGILQSIQQQTVRPRAA